MGAVSVPRLPNQSGVGVESRQDLVARSEGRPETAQAIAALPVTTMILDVEVCRLDEKLVSRLHLLSEPDGQGARSRPLR
jgi:hypothetical protein